jgi:hypothetical protein
MSSQSKGEGTSGPVPIHKNKSLSARERRYDFIAAAIGMLLALLFSSLVAWVTYLVVVKFFGQETITFWVALPSAILFWFLEEMLQLTLPCRRALRRLAHWLAECWVNYLTKEVISRSTHPTPANELRIHAPEETHDPYTPRRTAGAARCGTNRCRSVGRGSVPGPGCRTPFTSCAARTRPSWSTGAWAWRRSESVWGTRTSRPRCGTPSSRTQRPIRKCGPGVVSSTDPLSRAGAAASRS